MAKSNYFITRTLNNFYFEVGYNISKINLDLEIKCLVIKLLEILENLQKFCYKSIWIFIKCILKLPN